MATRSNKYIQTLTVSLWGVNIGTLQWNPRTQSSLFWFSPDYFTGGYDIAPITHPKAQQSPAIASNDIKIWDATTGRELQTIKGENWEFRCASFSPDGKHIVALTADNVMMIWDFLPVEQLIDVTYKRFKNYRLTSEERSKYYLE